MARRIDKSWLVFASSEISQHDRCVDLFRRRDHTHGFEAFRRDPEDAAGWTPVGCYAGVVHPSAIAAFDAAATAVVWLAEESRRRPELRTQSTAA